MRLATGWATSSVGRAASTTRIGVAAGGEGDDVLVTGDDLGGEPRLAETGNARDQHAPQFPRCGGAQLRLQDGHLVVTPNQSGPPGSGRPDPGERPNLGGRCPVL